jgi:hypothetical protein
MSSRAARVALLAVVVGISGQSQASAAALSGKDTTQQGYGQWFTIPTKGKVRAFASLEVNDHSVKKAAGLISIKNLNGKKAYVSYRPSGSRFGVGRKAWTAGPEIRPGSQYKYWWDYYYYPGLEPYAFEFRICLSKRGLDPCGAKLKIKEPPSRRF